MTETVPVEVPDHVVITSLRAAFAIECARCRVTEWLYHTVIMRDPDAIRKAVTAHAECSGR